MTGVFALRVWRVFDGDRFLPGGATVLVEGTRIVGVEPVACDVPEGCELLEYADSTLLPGLIDTHSHLVCDGEPGALDRVAGYTDDQVEAVMARSLAAQLAAGVTTVRDLGDRSFCVVDLRDREDGVRKPRILASGPPITSPGGHCHQLGGEVADRSAIAAAVRERAERKVNVVKVMASGGMLTAGSDIFGTQFDRDDVRYLVDFSHTLGLPVTAHAHSLRAVEDALAAGVDGIEHCSCLTENGRVVTDELIGALAESRIVVCLTLGNDMSRRIGSPPPQVAALLARFGLTLEEALGQRMDVVARMHEAGVRLVSGVDSGVGALKAHGNAWRAVADLAQAGVPTERALASGTSAAAEGCGIASTTGRLRAGYDADLLVVRGDVRADVTALAAVRAVVLRGALVFG
jgi:imidazolonepropionase-like amidohydrolase